MQRKHHVTVLWERKERKYHRNHASIFIAAWNCNNFDEQAQQPEDKFVNEVSITVLKKELFGFMLSCLSMITFQIEPAEENLSLKG